MSSLGSSAHIMGEPPRPMLGSGQWLQQYRQSWGLILTMMKGVMQDERDSGMKGLGALTCLASQGELLSNPSKSESLVTGRWGIIWVPTRHRVWLTAGSQSVLTRSVTMIGTSWGTLLFIPSRPPGASEYPGLLCLPHQVPTAGPSRTHLRSLFT